MRKQTLLSGLAKHLLIASALCPIGVSTGARAGDGTVQIISSPGASSAEQIAAAELAGYLARLYPGTRFAVADEATSRTGRAIRLGTPSSAPDLPGHVGDGKLHGPESYVVTRATIDGRETGIVLGADPAGVMYGVYGLLEELGCGFFLSFDTVPEPSGEAFGFDRWKLTDHPLTPIRTVFNWHNFLSGCTAWDLRHWKKWIARSQKCGFNTVMVHAYGNNPMFTFTFKGKTKPVGYLATTRQGRDWSTNHVNDVRRLHGGFLFDGPVFGSEAGKVPGDRVAESTRAMMQGVFACAERRGMKVNFALDFDIPSCNPQDMILKLHVADRFRIKNTWLARPDTPAGREFYKAQARALVEAYPQVDTVTLWRRYGGYCGATWPVMKLREMPKAWREEYNAVVKKDPAAARLAQSVPAFGMAKVAEAWRRALDELGRRDIELATGSWKFPWVPAAARFFPEEVKLIPLDSEVARGRLNLRNTGLMRDIDRAVPDGRMVPVIWAHHDDGEYVGAPLRVHDRFGSKLKDWGAGGFGIIHWMTHPLDLYFTSHGRQTWAGSADEPLEETCRWAAERWFGAANREVTAEYLRAWMTGMPFFGRETGDFFIDRPMKRHAPLDATVAGCASRTRLLDRADTSRMTADQKRRHRYFREYERFVSDLFRTQYGLEDARAAYRSGRLDRARELVSACNPEELVARYAGALRDVGVSRGEEGLIVTVNTRWIPHYVRFRQQVGLEAVRCNYAATSHEHLAQSRGVFTFHITPDKALWQTFGEEETGAGVFTIPDAAGVEGAAGASSSYGEICRSGIESGKPITITLAPILPRGSRGPLGRLPVPAGDYTLTLLTIEPTATRAGQRVMNLAVAGPASCASYSFSPLRTRHLRLACRGNSENSWNSIAEIGCPAVNRAGEVKASSERDGFEANRAVDGNTQTRWASQGRQWIQLAIDPDAVIDHVDIAWYDSHNREYDFDILVSDDGTQWRRVEYACETSSGHTVAVDIFRQAGGRNRILALEYPIELTRPGNVTVTLTPVKGKALICGAVLKPVDAVKAAVRKAE